MVDLTVQELDVFVDFLKKEAIDIRNITSRDKSKIISKLFSEYKTLRMSDTYSLFEEHLYQIISLLNEEEYKFVHNEYLNDRLRSKWWLEYYSQSTYHRFKRKLIDKLFYIIYGL